MALSGARLIRLLPEAEASPSPTSLPLSLSVIAARSSNPPFPCLRIRGRATRTADFIISASCQNETYVTGSRVRRIAGRPECRDEHRRGQTDPECKSRSILHVARSDLADQSY